MREFCPLIGVIGRSGAGKNVVSRLLAERGCYCIDADARTRELLESYGDSIVERFQVAAAARGLSLRRKDGGLHSAHLGVLLFSEPKLLQQHEEFLLPKVTRLLCEDIARAQAARPKAIVLNAPTLHKTELLQACSFVLYIWAPSILRMWRCKKRERVSFTHLLRRFPAQKGFYAQSIAQNADTYTVANCGRVASLARKVDCILTRRGVLGE